MVRISPVALVILLSFQTTGCNDRTNGNTEDPPLVKSFHKAIKDGDVIKIESLLNEYPQLIEKRNILEKTPLQQAAYVGQKEVAKLLIGKGADVKAVWESLGVQDGFNALHITAINGHTEVAKLLIDAGTPINGQSKLGETPLDVAIRNGHETLATLFKANGAKRGHDLSRRGQ